MATREALKDDCTASEEKVEHCISMPARLSPANFIQRSIVTLTSVPDFILPPPWPQYSTTAVRTEGFQIVSYIHAWSLRHSHKAICYKMRIT